MRCLVLLLVLGFASGLVQSAEAQQGPARVEAIVSADSVKVGERFTVSVVAEHQIMTEVRFPPASAGPVVFGDLEVVRRSDVAQRYLGSEGPGVRVDSVAYTVTTFALDEARVPALPIEVVAGTDTLLVSTQPQTVDVIRVVGPDAKGLQPLMPLASFPQPVWPWVLLGLAGAVAAGLAYAWWRDRQRPDASDAPAPAPEPEVNPYEQAQERMADLARMDLHDPVAVKPYYVRLSSTLRAYLAGRLGVAALERTTSELVQALKARDDVAPQAAGRIQAVLELADLVKFADTRPTPDDGRTALQETRTAIASIEEGTRGDVERESRMGDGYEEVQKT